MESSNLFNCAVRIKQEPRDKLLAERDDYKIIDNIRNVKHVKFSKLLRDNSAEMLKKCEDNHENEFNVIRIEFECELMKPSMNLLPFKKFDDYSQNHSQHMNHNVDYKIQKDVKIEIVDGVKKEFFGGEVNKFIMNFNRELNEQNELRNVKQEFDHEQRLKILSIETVHKGVRPARNICGKTFSKKSLHRHIDSMQNNITYICDICRKTFSRKGNLNSHINAVHKGITHACDTCGKTFSNKSNVKKHIISVHNGVKYACDICGSKFTKNYLKIHIDSVHNHVAHPCKVCGKLFSQASSLYCHVKTHDSIRYECDSCGKKFTWKTSLKKHINSVHIKIKHPCNICGKTFTRKDNLQLHICTLHNGIIHKCDRCGKRFTQNRGLQTHINAVHHSRIMT